MIEQFDLNQYEPYRLANEKLQAVKSQLSEAEEVVKKLQADRPGSIHAQKERKIEAFLQGKDIESVAKFEEWNENLTRATERLGIAREAYKRQEGIVKEERVKASKKVCEKEKQAYMKDCKEALLALVNLGEKLNIVDEWKDSFFQADISFPSYLPVLTNFNLGNLNDPQSHFAIWLKGAVEEKFINFQDIPKQAREKWYRLNGFKFPGDILTATPRTEMNHDEARRRKGIIDAKPETKKAEPIREGWNS